MLPTTAAQTQQPKRIRNRGFTASPRTQSSSPWMATMLNQVMKRTPTLLSIGFVIYFVTLFNIHNSPDSHDMDLELQSRPMSRILSHSTKTTDPNQAAKDLLHSTYKEVFGYSIRNMILGNFSAPESRKIMPNVIRASYRGENETVDGDVAMAMTAKPSQIPQLAFIVGKWNGPISVAVHIASQTDIDDFFMFYARHSKLLTTVSFHFLLEPSYRNRSVKQINKPVAKLMQLAVDRSPADYVLHHDIDFVPSNNFYEKVVQLLQTDPEVRNMVDEKTLFVVPSFEWSNFFLNLTNSVDSLNPAHDTFPLERHMILGLLERDLINTTEMRFYRRYNEDNPIIYEKWVGQKNISWYYSPFQPGYEAILLTKRKGMPRYWHKWKGPWFPRVGLIEECDANGYDLAVLKDFHTFRTRKGDKDIPVEDYAKEQLNEFRTHLPNRYAMHAYVPTVEDFDTKTYQDCILPDDIAPPSSERERMLICEWQDFANSSDHRRQVPRVIEGANVDRSVVEDEISLAIHGSIDRMDKLLNNAKRWVGPISVAIYTKSAEQIQQSFDFFKSHARALSKVSFHFFFEKILIEKDKLYPHNYVRNCALNFTYAEYVIILDMDFVPNRRAYGGLKSLIKNDKTIKSKLQNKTVMVMPAFETSLIFDNEEDMTLGLAPPSKPELLRAVHVDETVEAFHLTKFEPGHGPTNFDKWYNFTSGTSYDIEWDEGFEPYVLARREGLPWFWTNFRGFGKNKLSWYEDLDVMEYNFAVLRDFFVFHIGTSSVSGKFPWWTGYEYSKVFQVFLDVKARDLNPQKNKMFQSRIDRAWDPSW